jgi:hypothetical protein
VSKTTLAGLISRRAAMATELEQARDTMVVLAASLRRLDAAIRKAGATDIPAIRRQRLRLPNRERGPIVRPLLAILRTASEPISLRALTLRLMEQRGMDCADPRLYRNANHQVKMALAGQRRNGVVRAGRGAGPAVLWTIA